MKNYYKILGVEPGATPREIKKAYVPLALGNHPDLSHAADKADAHRRYREIQTAYWILSDRRLRERFDRKIGRRPNPDAVSDPALDLSASGTLIPPTERVDLERQFSKAESAFVRGDHWEAAGILEKITERHPGQPLWQLLYAQATSKCGAYDRARKAAETALVVDPESPGAHFIFAEVLSETGDFAGAARMCRRALDLDPNHTSAKELLRKATTLRVIFLRQKVTTPLYVASALAILALIATLFYRYLRL